MAKIGFNVTANAEKEEESLEEIQQILQGMEAENIDIKNELEEEIKNVNHLKKNIRLIEKIVLYIEKIMGKRKKLLIKLFALVEDPSFDVDEAEDISNKISHYTEIIFQKMRVIGQRIRNYILNDAHNVYLENVHNAETVKILDRIARHSLAALNVVNNEIGSHDQFLKEVFNKIRQRKNGRPVKKGNLGF